MLGASPNQLAPKKVPIVIRCLFLFALVAIGIALSASTLVAQEPFSYRGLYETSLASGSKLVLFVDSNEKVAFFYFSPANQVAQFYAGAIELNGALVPNYGTFDTVEGAISASFTNAGVTGFVGDQSFSSTRVELNSAKGGFEGFYLGSSAFILTPAGNFYSLGSFNVVGTYRAVQGSTFATFSGVRIPGGTAVGGHIENGEDTEGFDAFQGAGVLHGYFRDSSGFITSFYTIPRPNLTHRLVNISTRGNVGAGENQMIAGFVIQGGAKRVLVRALGPSLAAAGVAGPLADPFITLFWGSTPIASNDNWRVGNNVAKVLATGFAPNADRESALLVSLEEGAYTVVVTGAGGSTGVALVEVYEID